MLLHFPVVDALVVVVTDVVISDFIVGLMSDDVIALFALTFIRASVFLLDLICFKERVGSG